MSVWDSIVGQQAVVGQMQAIVSGDPKALAQSWLICGPPGSGRSNVARAFAAALQCPDGGCGDCRACRRGEPQYCFATFNATQRMTLLDGTELTPALGIGAFAEKTLVAAGQCTKVDPDARPAAVGLLGCGIMAGIGAAINTGGVTRGKSVAVIGCGGVGCAAIAGSALAGAGTIIAVDIDGLWRGKRIAAPYFLESVARKGTNICNILFGWDMQDASINDLSYTGWQTGYPDITLLTGLSTLKLR